MNSAAYAKLVYWRTYSTAMGEESLRATEKARVALAQFVATCVANDEMHIITDMLEKAELAPHPYDVVNPCQLSWQLQKHGYRVVWNWPKGKNAKPVPQIIKDP